MEEVGFQERIPKALRAFIILYHVLGVIPLIVGLGIGINELNPYDQYGGDTASIVLFSIALALYLVSCVTLNAGFRKKSNGALLATSFLLWAAVAGSCSIFACYVSFAEAAGVSGMFFISESIFLFVAYGCAMENEKREKNDIFQWIPKSIKTATIVFFCISLVMSFVAMIMMFCDRGTVTGFRGSSEVWRGQIGLIPFVGLLILIVAFILYLSGCKNNNKALKLSLLLIFIAQVVLFAFPVFVTNYGSIVDNKVGTIGKIICVIVGLGVLGFTFAFTFIALCINERAKRKVFLKMKSDERTTIRTGVFDYNKQNWWE